MWRQAIRILDGDEGLLAKFDHNLDHSEYVVPFSPRTKSASRLELYAMACKAAVGGNDLKKDRGIKWCEETLTIDPDNVDGLVGRGERLLNEEKWEEALRVLEHAFEKTGRSSQDVGISGDIG